MKARMNETENVVRGELYLVWLDRTNREISDPGTG